MEGYEPENAAAGRVTVTIDTRSVKTNHAERDKPRRKEDFLFVSKYPEARFVSKRVEAASAEKARIVGDLTLRGVTREVVIDASHVGGGGDPSVRGRMGSC